MNRPLLVEYYLQLPDRRDSDDKDNWRIRYQAASGSFQQQIAARYTEGTVLRLIDSGDAVVRRAAVLALSHLGTMDANAAVAARLHDEDEEVWKKAADALWAIWFRAGTEAQNQDLLRLVRTRDKEIALSGLERLTARAPTFAEALNQRAIACFRTKRFERSIEDCHKVLEINPHHFGAQAGIGQCYLQKRRHKAALKAFKSALKIHPRLDGVAATIRALENALDEEGHGRLEDRK